MHKQTTHIRRIVRAIVVTYAETYIVFGILSWLAPLSVHQMVFVAAATALLLSATLVVLTRAMQKLKRRLDAHRIIHIHIHERVLVVRPLSPHR